MTHKALIKRTMTLGVIATLSSGCTAGVDDSSASDELGATEDDVPGLPAGFEWNDVPGDGTEPAPLDDTSIDSGEARVLDDGDSGDEVEIAPLAPPREELSGSESIASKQQPLFNGKCKSVRIKVHNRATLNGKPVWIRIKRFKYWDLTSGVKRSEDVVDGEFFNGQWLQWSDENLEETKNHRIGSWFIYLQFAFPGEAWSGTVQTEVIPFVGYGEICHTDELYEMNIP